MKMTIFGILDRKIGIINIFCEQNDNAAIRGFAYAVRKKDSLMNAYPRDYALMKLGYMNVEDGMLIPLSPNLVLVNGDEVDNYET